MVQASLSSGDVLADRRAAYAKMLSQESQFAQAAELMEQALELAPDWRAGWFLLGEYREKADDTESAVRAYEHVLAMEGEDVFGARLKLAVLGAAAVPASPESTYAESLFDGYADRFEKALTEKLGYEVPARLADCLMELCGKEARFAFSVDLGCGTGLAGPEIRPFVDYLEGFDISLNMLSKAREKEVYDHLARADLSLAPQESGLFSQGQARRRADLAIAADVMMYLGDLEAPFRLVAELMAPGGLFAFSVEGVREGFVLRPSLRYAHSPDHVEALFQRHGFIRRLMQPLTIRMDGGKPVPGFVFIAEKTG